MRQPCRARAPRASRASERDATVSNAAVARGVIGSAWRSGSGGASWASLVFAGTSPRWDALMLLADQQGIAPANEAPSGDIPKRPLERCIVRPTGASASTSAASLSARSHHALLYLASETEYAPTSTVGLAIVLCPASNSPPNPLWVPCLLLRWYGLTRAPSSRPYSTIRASALHTMSARPILPLPSNFAAANFQHDQPPDRASQPPAPNRPTYAKRGKITIVACVPCRRRKTKVEMHRSQATPPQNYKLTDLAA
jgi:hypothetical protein